MRCLDSLLWGRGIGIVVGLVGGIILSLFLLIFISRKKYLAKITSGLEKEGVITENQKDIILSRVGLTKSQITVSKTDFLSKFIIFLVSVATIAISVGIILFFASNWEVLSKSLKISLSLSIGMLI